MRHRVALKLSLGERVVVHVASLSSDRQRQLAAIATNQGASIYTITDQAETIGEMLRPSVNLRPIQSLPTLVEVHLRGQHWQGITIIGDVHGELLPLERALAWAQSRQHFVWFLGDILDYGKQSLETVDLVHHAVMHGEATMMLANHERKIARWLNRDGEHLRLSDGNRVTIDAYHRLVGGERDRWAGRLRGLLAHSTLTQEIGDITILHAAAHPSMWGKQDAIAIEQFALYGEADHSSGRYRRSHHWVDAVPEGKMVIVGHDIVSEYPMLVTGASGGSVVFLDTGCGKGGQLSSADLRFTNDGLHLECFKRH
jgi:protein phosphatase